MKGPGPKASWSLELSALTGAVVSMMIFFAAGGTAGPAVEVFWYMLPGAALFALAAYIHNRFALSR